MAREPQYSPEDAYDAMVWMHLKVSGTVRNKALLNETSIRAAAEQVKPRSPVFATLDSDACVARLIAGIQAA